MADYIGMTPTVVIGLGGTGKEVLIKVRRMIVETYGSLDALPILSFLHIDTEQNAKVSEPQVVLKQDISLRPAEQVWAKVEDAKAILNKLSAYEHLAEWFPSQLKGTDSILAGAGQIRSLGKFAFTLNYQNIKTSFNNVRSRIVGHEKFMLDRWGVQLDKGVNIFIVCSLSGGTGSGMVLDIAYNLRDWVPPSDLPQSSAYLVLPGAFAGLGDRVVANAYTALMELNHYSRNDTRFETQYSPNPSDRISSQSSQDVPFNFCYLVGNSNDKVTFPSLNSVLEMVSQNIFLDFSSGFSQYKKLVRDNIRKHWASPDSKGSATQAEVQAKQNLILAKVFGLVVEEENSITKYSEVRFHYQDKITGLKKTQVLGNDWQEAEEYLVSDHNRRVREILEDALQNVGQKAVTKTEKQGLYQKLMAHLRELEKTLSGAKDNPNYCKQEIAIEDYVKTYSLFTAAETISASVQKSAELPKNPSANSTASEDPDSKLEKFTKLVETCYRRGNPSETQLQMLEHFRQKYGISQVNADQIIAKFSCGHSQQQALYEYGLMYRAFLESNTEIDFEQQTQLLELQEELGLTNKQVATMEANIQEELGLTEAR